MKKWHTFKIQLHKRVVKAARKDPETLRRAVEVLIDGTRQDIYKLCHIPPKA